MRIQNLDPKKYKRFFAFGCSFTNYMWPTWADIIGQDSAVYENWGRGGAGNHFIFNSVVEAHSRHSFTEDDLIIIMWSSITREDRYSNNDWLVAPIAKREKIYGKDWVKKFGTDNRGYLIRDCAMIRSTQILLKTTGCDYAQMVLQPLTNFDLDLIYSTYGADIKLPDEQEGRNYWKNTFNDLCRDGIIHPMLENKDVLEIYKDIFLEFELYHDVEVASFRNDLHPTPLGALAFLDNAWPENKLSDAAREYANFWQEQIMHTRPIMKPVHSPSYATRL